MVYLRSTQVTQKKIHVKQREVTTPLFKTKHLIWDISQCTYIHKVYSRSFVYIIIRTKSSSALFKSALLEIMRGKRMLVLNCPNVQGVSPIKAALGRTKREREGDEKRREKKNANKLQNKQLRLQQQNGAQKDFRGGICFGTGESDAQRINGLFVSRNKSK